MKCRIGLLAPLALCCTLAFAQESSTYTQQDSNTHTTTYPSAQGPVIVNWGQPAAHPYGPPPAFAQLDTRGTGYVTGDEAAAYPPLANDFIHADGNRDGRVSRAEYDRWQRSSSH
jgi:hypothetical protein